MTPPPADRDDITGYPTEEPWTRSTKSHFLLRTMLNLWDEEFWIILNLAINAIKLRNYFTPVLNCAIKQLEKLFFTHTTRRLRKLNKIPNSHLSSCWLVEILMTFWWGLLSSNYLLAELFFVSFVEGLKAWKRKILVKCLKSQNVTSFYYLNFQTQNISPMHIQQL